MSELPLRAILARVSRSFYLSLWLLPEPTRETVALAYLLARAADTVADTRLVSAADRLRMLDAVRALVDGTASGDARRETLEELSGLGQTDDVLPEERALLGELERCLELLERLPDEEQRLVRKVLDVLTSGMQADLRRFPGQAPAELEALGTRAELLEYCYQVAGCVGEFWSELHALRLPTLRAVDLEPWKERGVRLGRALQLTNVLRDVRRDLEHGRCYLPRDDLRALGLTPSDLLRPDAWPRLTPLYDALLRQAVSDAEAGLRYTLTIRPREVRLRLAGLLPLLLALQTLGVVRAGNPLAPDARRKVTRRTVYADLVRCWLAAREDRAVARLYRAVLRESGLRPYARSRS